MLNTSSSRFLVLIFSSVFLLLAVGASTTSADAQKIELENDDLILEEISNEEAKQNLIDISGYTEEEANSAVYGNELGIKNEITAAKWSTVTHHAPNAKIVGQVRLDNGRIVGSAPQTNVIADSSCDMGKIEYSTLTVIDSYSVRLKSKYRIACGAIPFNETVNTVKNLR